MKMLYIIIVSWLLIWSPNPEPDMNHYIVYRSTEDSISFKVVAQIQHPDTVYIDNDLVIGYRYFYYLKAVNDSGQQSLSSDTINELYPLTSITIKDTVIEYPVMVYPNPAKNILTLQGKFYGSLNIKIYNILGEKVIEINNLAVNRYQNGYAVSSVGISHLVAGTYFYKIQNKKRIFIGRFIKL